MWGQRAKIWRKVNNWWVQVKSAGRGAGNYWNKRSVTSPLPDLCLPGEVGGFLYSWAEEGGHCLASVALMPQFTTSFSVFANPWPSFELAIFELVTVRIELWCLVFIWIYCAPSTTLNAFTRIISFTSVQLSRRHWKPLSLSVVQSKPTLYKTKLNVSGCHCFIGLYRI